MYMIMQANKVDSSLLSIYLEAIHSVLLLQSKIMPSTIIARTCAVSGTGFMVSF